MIETIVLDYLGSAIPAYMELPPGEKETPFLVIEKTGGGETNHIRRATVAVQSYGSTMLEAAQTNETVKTLMERLPELDDVAGCTLNADYNFTDTASKRYRYQAVFDIYHY